MSAPSVSLGYVILCVKDVAASLAFYEAAFGLSRRFFHDDGVNAYGELETGATRLARNVALVTADVSALFARAVKAGAKAMCEPAAKPWGQTVAYVRDNSGHLVELCTPVP
jgi:uncharacterized glyoxalase superfamily protein PhnB